MKRVLVSLALIIGLVFPVLASGGLWSDEEVVRVLIETLDVGDSDEFVAYLVPYPLAEGTVITSDGGERYVLEERTWFAFIDDEPCAFFEHPVRYAFIDVETGEVELVDDGWPPEIAGIGLWWMDDLIEIYPSTGWTEAIDGSPGDSAMRQATQPPAGDYGDAPDGTLAYNGVVGSFPTKLATANSRIPGSPGGHAIITGLEMLGRTVSAERGATDPADPDMIQNLVDNDLDDQIFLVTDGVVGRLYAWVTVDKNAPDVPRYINALCDLDRDGSWQNVAGIEEWTAVNVEVSVAPGTSELIRLPTFMLAGGDPFWVRVALTRPKVDENAFAAVGGWDGSGRFEFGEVEDHIVYPSECPNREPPVHKPPPPPPPPGSPGPQQGNCGCPVEYYALVIDGGEHRGRSGTTEAADGMYALLKAQGYKTTYLGPKVDGHVKLHSEDKIKTAIEGIAEDVTCCDHVFIYIIGHGFKTNAKDPENPPKGRLKQGGIRLQHQGEKRDLLKPTELDKWLEKIGDCKKNGDFEDCDKKEESCEVTILIETCHAGNFLAPLAKPGREVAVSSTAAQKSYRGSDGTGGEFSDGFIDAYREVPPPKSFLEACKGAADYVKAKKYGDKQTPQLSKEEECECVCPCAVKCGPIWYIDLWWIDPDAIAPDVEFLVPIVSLPGDVDPIKVGLVGVTFRFKAGESVSVRETGHGPVLVLPKVEIEIDFSRLKSDVLIGCVHVSARGLCSRTVEDLVQVAGFFSGVEIARAGNESLPKGMFAFVRLSIPPRWEGGFDRVVIETCSPIDLIPWITIIDP